jgi:hypothetical protein
MEIYILLVKVMMICTKQRINLYFFLKVNRTGQPMSSAEQLTNRPSLESQVKRVKEK